MATKRNLWTDRAEIFTLRQFVIFGVTSLQIALTH